MAVIGKFNQSKRWLRNISLSALLLLSGVGFVGEQAVAPPPVQAYTSRVAVLIDRRVDGDFDALLSRAEAAARRAGVGSGGALGLDV